MTTVACPEIPRAVEAQRWAVYSLNINASISPGWRQAKQPKQKQEVAGSSFFCLFVFSSHLSPNFQLEPRSALPFQHAGKGCGVGKNQATRAGISSPNSKSLELNELCVDRGRLGTFTVSSRRFGGPGCVLKRALLSAGTHDGIGTAPECCRRALQTQC